MKLIEAPYVPPPSDTIKVTDYYVPHDGKLAWVRKIAGMPLELMSEDVVIVRPADPSWMKQAQAPKGNA